MYRLSLLIEELIVRGHRRPPTLAACQIHRRVSIVHNKPRSRLYWPGFSHLGTPRPCTCRQYFQIEACRKCQKPPWRRVPDIGDERQDRDRHSTLSPQSVIGMFTSRLNPGPIFKVRFLSPGFVYRMRLRPWLVNVLLTWMNWPRGGYRDWSITRTCRAIPLLLLVNLWKNVLELFHNYVMIYITKDAWLFETSVGHTTMLDWRKADARTLCNKMPVRFLC